MRAHLYSRLPPPEINLPPPEINLPPPEINLPPPASTSLHLEKGCRTVPILLLALLKIARDCRFVRVDQHNLFYPLISLFNQAAKISEHKFIVLD